jgi:antitoxin component of RelBE/YafQ-DinJ toxin-antitoxin module
MVQQMANEMGPGVTVSQAMNTLLEALAKEGRLRIQITGDPPEEVLAGIFVFSLLRHGVLHPMAQA